MTTCTTAVVASKKLSNLTGRSIANRETNGTLSGIMRDVSLWRDKGWSGCGPLQVYHTLCRANASPRYRLGISMPIAFINSFISSHVARLALGFLSKYAG